MLTSLLLTGTLMNIGTLFSVSAMASAATASFVGASICGFASLINFVKVCHLGPKPDTIVFTSTPERQAALGEGKSGKACDASAPMAQC